MKQFEEQTSKQASKQARRMGRTGRVGVLVVLVENELGVGESIVQLLHVLGRVRRQVVQHRHRPPRRVSSSRSTSSLSLPSHPRDSRVLVLTSQLLDSAQTIRLSVSPPALHLEGLADALSVSNDFDVASHLASRTPRSRQAAAAACRSLHATPGSRSDCSVTASASRARRSATRMSRRQSPSPTLSAPVSAPMASTRCS